MKSFSDDLTVVVCSMNIQYINNYTNIIKIHKMNIRAVRNIYRVMSYRWVGLYVLFKRLFSECYPRNRAAPDEASFDYINRNAASGLPDYKPWLMDTIITSDHTIGSLIGWLHNKTVDR